MIGVTVIRQEEVNIESRFEFAVVVIRTFVSRQKVIEVLVDFYTQFNVILFLVRILTRVLA